MTQMAATTTTIDKILKLVYTSKALQNAVYNKNPLLAMLPKQGGFNGRSIVHANTYQNSNARNATFATAQSLAGINGAANNGVSSSTAATDSGFNVDVNFTVSRVKNYAMYTIEQEAILASKGDNGAFVQAATQLIDGTLQTLRNDFGRDLYGDASGVVAQASLVSTVNFTVGEAITQIERGMALVAAATIDGDIRGTTSAVPMRVISVNRAAGTFVVHANTDSAATGDYLFIAGDRPATGATAATRRKISGLNAWNPITAPSASESFFGVDRSVDSTRLAGMRLDISAMQPEEGYITALAAMAREDSDPSHIFTSFTDEKNLKLALGSRVECEYSAVGEVGFESIRLRGPNGVVKVYADRNAPVGYARLLQMDTWVLKHLGDLVNKGDAGNDAGMAREILADRYEGRFSFYGNLLCLKPSANMVATLPT